MALKFANNAKTTLASSITNSQTSVILQAGQGAKFPTISGSDYFYVTVVDTPGNVEIMKVTARVSDTLTVIRAQEGTTARAFAAGSYIANHTTAAQLASFFNQDNDGPGSGLDADTLDGYQTSTTAVASTIPVRNGSGQLAGDITGNAATATNATSATNATTATNVSGGTANVTTVNASGNVTLGSGTGNSHTVNGALSATGSVSATQFAASTGSYELKADGYFYSSNGGAAGVPRSGILALGSSQNLALITANTTRYQVDSAGNFSRVIPGGTTLYPEFACRAWGRISNVGAITGAGNVSSVGSVAGSWVINLSAALPDTNCGILACQVTSSGYTMSGIMNSASQAQITALNGATATLNNMSFAIFR